MTGIAVADKSFMMASAGAEGAGEAGVAIVFRIDMTAAQKVFLFLTIDSRRNMSQGMGIGIDETMAWCDILGSLASFDPDIWRPEHANEI